MKLYSTLCRSFADQFHDEPSPPKKIFPNSHSSDAFEEFITNTILERVANGSLVFWMQLTHAPHLVMPITIAPTKPPMCHDERFLNLWIKDLPFIGLITYQTFLDTLAEIISRRFVMTKVVTTMCLLHPSVARYLVYHGKTVISHLPLFSQAIFQIRVSVSTKTKHDFSSGTCEDKTTRIFLCFAICSALGLCLDYDLMLMTIFTSQA